MTTNRTHWELGKKFDNLHWSYLFCLAVFLPQNLCKPHQKRCHDRPWPGHFNSCSQHTWKYLTLFRFMTSSIELIELSPLLILKHQKQSTVFLALFTTNNIATRLLNQVNNQSLKQPSTQRRDTTHFITQTMTAVQFAETSLSSLSIRRFWGKGERWKPTI